MTIASTSTSDFTHGVDCPKVLHAPGKSGYLHGASDDRPYDVDGVWYCGRCHTSICWGWRECDGDSTE
jgi:hypothetical protein